MIDRNENVEDTRKETKYMGGQIVLLVSYHSENSKTASISPKEVKESFPVNFSLTSQKYCLRLLLIHTHDILGEVNDASEQVDDKG